MVTHNIDPFQTGNHNNQCRVSSSYATGFEHHMIISPLSLRKLWQASLLITLPKKKSLIQATLPRTQSLAEQIWRAASSSALCQPDRIPDGHQNHTLLQFINAHLKPFLFIRGGKVHVAEGEGVEKERGGVKACVQC